MSVEVGQKYRGCGSGKTYEVLAVGERRVFARVLETGQEVIDDLEHFGESPAFTFQLVPPPVFEGTVELVEYENGAGGGRRYWIVADSLSARRTIFTRTGRTVRVQRVD